MPFAFKNKPLTKQSFKLSPFASKILIKKYNISKTYISKALARQITNLKKKFQKNNVHISTNKIFLNQF